MSFNASKCYILSIQKKSSHYYQLNDTILKEVSSNPYLGVTISSDLKWSEHISNICSRASSTLGFVRRNLRHCPIQTRRTAYLSLVRSTLEYASTIWDPYLQGDIAKLERVQRQAVRYVCKDYRSREPGSVTRMLEDQNLPPLQKRRKDLRLALLFKVVEGLVPAVPPEDYLTPARNKRKIKAKSFKNCETKNFVEKIEIKNSRGFVTPLPQQDCRKNSFFVRTVKDWNHLDETVVTAPSLESFKSRLQSN